MKPEKKKSGACRKAYNGVLDLDQFGQEIQFHMPNGQRTYNTMLGACMSVFLFVIVVVYGCLHLLQFYVEGPVVTRDVKESYFSSNFVTPSDLGLEFAFAITAYNSANETPLTPEIGKLTAYYATWGIKDDQSYTMDEIPTH